MGLTNRERFRRVLNFEPVDRLPVIEWAPWWDKTLARWREEGLPPEPTDALMIRERFGMDRHRQIWIGGRTAECPRPAGHGLPIVTSVEEYRAIKRYLYPELTVNPDALKTWAAEQAQGDLVIWITLDGFFWWPRVLLGIEPHLYAFYDQPELMNEINKDLVAFQERTWDRLCEICVPDLMTFAEDMSYNHGPMLSRAQFDEFLAPFYRRIIPRLRERGTTVFLDTDGDVTKPVSWYEEVGIQGFLPLERMAGVDVNQLRADHPQLRMLGAYDKTVMHLGEERIRQEFERLMPAMKQGGFIVSVDHQTPPEVSLEQYRQWLGLLREYCERAAQQT